MEGMRSGSVACAPLPRGKRRGDFQRPAEFEADYQLHLQNGGGNNGAGDCFNSVDAAAKRHCSGIGIGYTESSSKCNTDAALFFNGHPPHQADHTSHLLGLQTLPSDAHMNTDSPGERRLTNGADVHSCNSDHIMHHQNEERKKEQKTVVMNGYYGYIANYEPAGRDAEEESAMDVGLDVGQAEYAINGPSTCILPSERRVCSRCSAGEPGHITHIMSY